MTTPNEQTSDNSVPNATSIDAMLEARKMSKTKKEAVAAKKLDQVCESVEMIMEVIGALHPFSGIWSNLYRQIKGETFKAFTKEYVTEVVSKERVEVLALRSELEQSKINFNLLAEEVLRLQRQAYGPKPFLGVPPGPFTGKPLKHFKGSLHNPDPGYFPVHSMPPYGDFCPPFAQLGQYPQFQNSPYVTNPVHPGELLQRIMGLESAVAQLQQRQSSSMFQPQQPMGGYHQQKSTMETTVRHNQGASKVYGYVEELLKTKPTITVDELLGYMGAVNFQWSQHLPDHLSPSGWLAEVLSCMPPFVSFHFKPANNHLEGIIASKHMQSSFHQPQAAPKSFTQMSDNEKQIAAYIQELVISKPVYKYTTVGDLIEHMNKRGYVWDNNKLGIKTVSGWVNEVCSVLAPTIGLMYLKSNKMDDSCIAAYQPEVNRVLLNHVLELMKLHSDFSSWDKSRLISNLCASTGTAASLVDCYFHEWKMKGVVQETTEAASLATNSPYFTRLGFDMDKVNAMLTM